MPSLGLRQKRSQLCIVCIGSVTLWSKALLMAWGDLADLIRPGQCWAGKFRLGARGGAGKSLPASDP